MPENDRHGVDGPATDRLLRAGRFFTRWDESDDGRAVFREGGGERGRQHHPRCEQLHQLRVSGGREWTAVADRRFEPAVDRLVRPLQTRAVDDEPTR